jgi:hypothetical protein
VAILQEYVDFLKPRGVSPESAAISDTQVFLDLLEQAGRCEREELIALARVNYLAGNNEVYIYFTQVIERGNIIGNLRSHMEHVLGPARAGKVFAGAQAPAEGASPTEAVSFTRRLVESLQEQVSSEECENALHGNAHGIPQEAFADERKHFLASSSLEEYLTGYHDRSVATLTEHARTGTVWFEQEITEAVVSFVRENVEVLGGRLDGDTIYWTKIPFKPADWLAESSAEKRRYLACHCPMAREALKDPGGSFPRVWCNCTAGYIAQRFNAIFGEETEVELLESVLDRDDRCRFAVRVPAGVSSQFGQSRA